MRDDATQQNLYKTQRQPWCAAEDFGTAGAQKAIRLFRPQSSFFFSTQFYSLVILSTSSTGTPNACGARIVQAFWVNRSRFHDCAIHVSPPSWGAAISQTVETKSLRDNLKQKPTSVNDVFPKHIADALNAGKKVEAESHEIVTIVFSDIVGFTTISEKFPPMKVSNMLDRLHQAFDALADKHHIFNVETIWDANMGVTNLDGGEYDTNVKQIADF